MVYAFVIYLKVTLHVSITSCWIRNLLETVSIDGGNIYVKRFVQSDCAFRSYNPQWNRFISYRLLLQIRSLLSEVKCTFDTGFYLQEIRVLCIEVSNRRTVTNDQDYVRTAHTYLRNLNAGNKAFEINSQKRGRVDWYQGLPCGREENYSYKHRYFLRSIIFIMYSFL